MDVPILILIVEDEFIIQETLVDAFADGGYAVATAANGEDAIPMLEAHKGECRALITDVNLGRNRLTGYEVAKRARELIPDMPVVYITGDSGHSWSAKGVPNSLLVTKPFAPTQVVAAVAQLMSAASFGGAG